MRCPTGHENPTGSNFCVDCGTALATEPESESLCPNGHTNPGAANYCMTCGAVVAQPAHEPSSSRPTVPPSGGQPPRPRRRNRAVLIGLSLFVIGGVAAGVAWFFTAADDKDGDDARDSTTTPTSTEPRPEPPLQVAYDLCSTGKGGGTLDIGDEGRTLIIDTRSEHGPVDGLTCVFFALDTSEAVVAQMGNTTAMMGVQQAQDGDLNYQFSYHPDNGINVVITDTSSGD